MTRAIAIFLIAIHLMNIIGIYSIIAIIEDVHQKEISDQLDDDEYAGSDAITIKIPYSLPYSTFSENKNYERTHGKIEYEGQVYYMVKHKFQDNTLFIVCVRDAKLAGVTDAFKDLATSMTDKHNGKSSGKTVVTAPIKDYVGCHTVELQPSLIELESLRLPEVTFAAIINSQSPLDQPPRV
jgi:hypothetical protein